MREKRGVNFPRKKKLGKNEERKVAKHERLHKEYIKGEGKGNQPDPHYSDRNEHREKGRPRKRIKNVTSYGRYGKRLLGTSTGRVGELVLGESEEKGQVGKKGNITAIIFDWKREYVM